MCVTIAVPALMGRGEKAQDSNNWQVFGVNKHKTIFMFFFKWVLLKRLSQVSVVERSCTFFCEIWFIASLIHVLHLLVVKKGHNQRKCCTRGGLGWIWGKFLLWKCLHTLEQAAWVGWSHVPWEWSAMCRCGRRGCGGPSSAGFTVGLCDLGGLSTLNGWLTLWYCHFSRCFSKHTR